MTPKTKMKDKRELCFAISFLALDQKRTKKKEVKSSET